MRADIAIVQLVPAPQRVGKHLSNCVEKVKAIIELKYKSADVVDDFYADVKKLYDYSKLFPDSQLYAGFIHEERYNDSNCSWFDSRQTSKWAKVIHQNRAIYERKIIMRYIIDRFEGNYAVCEDENKNMVNIERNKLPLPAKEGDVLSVEGNDIKVDYDSTEARKQKIKKMMESLWE